MDPGCRAGVGGRCGAEGEPGRRGVLQAERMRKRMRRGRTRLRVGRARRLRGRGAPVDGRVRLAHRRPHEPRKPRKPRKPREPYETGVHEAECGAVGDRGGLGVRVGEAEVGRPDGDGGDTPSAACVTSAAPTARVVPAVPAFPAEHGCSAAYGCSDPSCFVPPPPLSPELCASPASVTQRQYAAASDA